MGAKRLPSKKLAAQSINKIDWKCLGCQHIRKSTRIPGVTATTIKCKGDCFRDTVHVALQ